MDKTFAEVSGAIPFDWNIALDNPPECGSTQHDTLKALSTDWVTCACGNQCAIIPRYNVAGTAADPCPDRAGLRRGQPIDGFLYRMGVKFCIKVYDSCWIEAKAILLQIEQRAEILIAEELRKLNNEAETHKDSN